MSISCRYILFVLSVFTLASPHAAGAEVPIDYEFQSKRQIGQVDHASVLLDANGDLLVKSGTGAVA